FLGRGREGIAGLSGSQMRHGRRITSRRLRLRSASGKLCPGRRAGRCAEPAEASKRPKAIQNNEYFVFMRPSLVLLVLTTLAFSQSPNREERRKNRVREEYLKATEHIHVPTITADSLKAHLADTDLVLVDVRQPNEQMVSMLPGAFTPYEFAQKF